MENNSKQNGSKQNDSARQYWRANSRLVLGLLLFWFAASFGCGILFADALDTVRIGGFKLGFWFAQQGSIFVFVILIFVYIQRMDKLDKEYKKYKSNKGSNKENNTGDSP